MVFTDELPLQVHPRQTSQQELPEVLALLDLAEHWLNRLHPEGVALTSPFRPQLAPRPKLQTIANKNRERRQR